MRNFEEMAKVMYPDMVQDKEDEQVVENEEEPESPESEPVLTEEQAEFMDWLNSLGLPDYEE